MLGLACWALDVRVTEGAVIAQLHPDSKQWLTVTYLARTGLADFLIFMDLWKILDGE